MELSSPPVQAALPPCMRRRFGDWDRGCSSVGERRIWIRRSGVQFPSSAPRIAQLGRASDRESDCRRFKSFSIGLISQHPATVLSEKAVRGLECERPNGWPKPSGADQPECLSPPARGQARGDDQGAVSPAREAKASGARFTVPRSAPASPPRIDATSPRIIRARAVTQDDDVKRETKRTIDA